MQKNPKPIYFVACQLEDDYEIDLLPVVFHTQDKAKALRLASCLTDFPEKHLMVAYDDGTLDKVFPRY
jgi:hypothetical protein